MTEAFIIDAVRTPRGRGIPKRGSLSGVHAQELMAQTLNGLIERNGVESESIEEVVLGCVVQRQDQVYCIARQSVMAAGWPLSIPGVTLNQVCGSGLRAVDFARASICAGHQDLLIAGGVESLSRVRMFDSLGGGLDGNNELLRQRLFQLPLGISADLFATLISVSREEADEYALISQMRAKRAQEKAYFEKSLLPVIDPTEGHVVLDRDELPRHDTTLKGLAKLEPSFVELGATTAGFWHHPKLEQPAELESAEGETWDEVALRQFPRAGANIEHIHTMGNTGKMADGAAAVLVASRKAADDHDLRPRARIVTTVSCGVDPVLVYGGAVEAVKRALSQSGMRVEDLDLVEINEAFAAVVPGTIRELELDLDRVNVNGGAIALGHPFGATGSVLIGTLLDELERRDLSTGLVTLAAGSGQGVAMILERVG